MALLKLKATIKYRKKTKIIGSWITVNNDITA